MKFLRGIFILSKKEVKDSFTSPLLYILTGLLACLWAGYFLIIWPLTGFDRADSFANSFDPLLWQYELYFSLPRSLDDHAFVCRGKKDSHSRFTASE